eukprot:CAMPEP_0203824600 /NCGR_PEP_ID=MMETSP0115-20131106/52144_1 /ASSEMBLY_ACC=CAM_ASM_000227 /TAXON_ID=33651 /ORGANISM="Bicosoecid sp, Strain ms1" /LENGTH=160 /DNA_ID=CAMNT_0050733645 /DNA_START=506 /DNA_END=984 /DNA_ORIENTATION=-
MKENRTGREPVRGARSNDNASVGTSNAGGVGTADSRNRLDCHDGRGCRRRSSASWNREVHVRHDGHAAHGVVQSARRREHEAPQEQQRCDDHEADGVSADEVEALRTRSDVRQVHALDLAHAEGNVLGGDVVQQRRLELSLRVRIGSVVEALSRTGDDSS